MGNQDEQRDGEKIITQSYISDDPGGEVTFLVKATDPLPAGMDSPAWGIGQTGAYPPRQSDFAG